MNSQLEKNIREWFSNLGFYEGTSPSNKESAQDKLQGFLSAYEMQGYITAEESKILFEDLTEEPPFVLRTDI